MITPSLRITAVVLLLAAAPAPGQTTVRLTLDEAIARAVHASHVLAEASAREAGAVATVRATHVADRPTLDASATYTRTNHVEEIAVPNPSGGLRVLYPDLPDNVLTRVNFQWPIYTAGRTDALQRAAEAEARAASADVQAARADLKLEVVRAYWALATATESQRVLTEAVTRADAHLRDVRSRFDAGLLPPNEVSSADAQRSRQRLQLIEASNLRRGVLEDLRRLTGTPTDIELAEPLEAVASTAKGTVADTATRAEREAAANRILAADERRRAAEASRRPTVAVTGSLDYANPNPRIFPRRDAWQESWEVGITANWRLWDGGRTAAEIGEAAAAVTASRARLAELDSLIALDVRQRTLDADSARASLVAAADGVRSATEARRVVAERFTVGVATSTEVLDAQLALLQAELDRTRALANIRLAEARLDRALGR